MKYQAHETAVIDKGATIGEYTRVWHFSHICGGAQIGNHWSLGQNVFVANRTRIGNNVKIQNNVSIYDDVTLEDGVFCGPSCVFTNVVNPRSLVSRKHEYAHTVIRKGATLGANCTVVCDHVVGPYAFVATGAVITKDVPAYALMAGVPASQIGWSRAGLRLELPLSGQDEANCPESGKRYHLSGDILEAMD